MIPFTKRWFDKLSGNAKERMPWVIQSLKSSVWRLYYRAETKERANEMAHGLRNATGKQRHLHAIRVVNEKTDEKGVFLPDLYADEKQKKAKASEKEVSNA